MVHTIDGAMAEALSCLRLVSNQFRTYGRAEAANALGKLSVELVSAFSGAVQDLPTEAYLFNDNCSARRAKQENEEKEVNNIAFLGTKEKQGVLPTIPEKPQQPIIQTLKENWAQTANTIRPTPSIAASIAQIAQSAQPQIKIHTPTMEMDQKQSMLTYLSLAEQTTASIPAPGIAATEEERKAGVVYLHGTVFQNFIRFVTARIHEGPLQEIVIESAQKTKIVFLHAANAREFVKSNEQKLSATGFSRFGAGYTVELVDAAMWNDNQFMMIHPFKERRRLTFARQKLFSQNLTAARWRRDIADIVGAHNIDFLWVFNSGNATAVFTSTVVARKVLERFKKLKVSRGSVYQGVDVSYSSDPCEKELHLTTQAKTPYRALELPLCP
ncbi:hypothetical protein NFIA_035480 [Paecilomyces variotii No. 5]|uniref:Uncharacterized protein n=1 Tax=Byssochlamys spectabilis (strain No. 5 / NBRC 109023) TaxID=1356009 RepID=V5HUR4_BYSSN|nr:hypothetical protein NFIA_035480 [Paecilomyces variotii No. 5]